MSDFQLLSEKPFHKHCDLCFGLMKRYEIWDENEFWNEVEYCPFCKGTEVWAEPITDDLEPDYTNDYIEMEEEMDTNLRW